MNDTAASLRRWGVMTDRVLPGRRALIIWILAAAAAISLLAVTATLGATEYRTPAGAIVIFATMLAAAIPGALIAPYWATAAAVLAAASLTALASPETAAPWPVAVPTMIALTFTWIIVGLRARWWVAASGWALTNFIALMTASEYGQRVAVGTIVADLVVFASVSLLGVGVGVMLRNWTLIRAELTRQQAMTAAEHARREAVEDKARIARELHDVVAHGMSAIQIRAASARYRLTGLSDEAAAEFDDLAATARTSMAEMRTILGLLRDEESAVQRAPQPGFGDLSTLIARARDLAPVTESGLWELSEAEQSDPVFGLTVYRVVQEALSNAARHAPGAATRIDWQDEPGARVLTITNDAPEHPAATRVDGGGQGLRGMRERVSALGGAVSAAPVEDPAAGGFRVRVTFPRA